MKFIAIVGLLMLSITTSAHEEKQDNSWWWSNAWWNDGKIENIKVNLSSGYNVLDQAAVISLKKIGQLPSAASWLINGMEIQIPIIYQLTQG